MLHCLCGGGDNPPRAGGETADPRQLLFTLQTRNTIQGITMSYTDKEVRDLARRLGVTKDRVTIAGASDTVSDVNRYRRETRRQSYASTTFAVRSTVIRRRSGAETPIDSFNVKVKQRVLGTKPPRVAAEPKPRSGGPRIRKCAIPGCATCAVFGGHDAAEDRPERKRKAHVHGYRS
jgi:hypothetical protein